jgi:Spy/CpxP family protein refolding chaperone/Ni/Co efflux regulator RcnB
MKTQLFFLLALPCLFFLSVTGYTQPQPTTPVTQQESRQRRIEKRKGYFREHWESPTSSISAAECIHDPDLRRTLGISDEQYEQRRVAMSDEGREKVLNNNPEYVKMQREFQEEMNAIYRRNGIDPDKLFAQKAPGEWSPLPRVDADSEKQFDDLSRRRSRLQLLVVADVSTTVLKNILTPEQERKIYEAMLANMGYVPMISPIMFEGLDLTDAQKQQMKTLEKDFAPEFKKYCEDFASRWITFEDILFSTLDKQEGTTLAEQMQATRKILEENPEYKKIMAEIPALQKTFAAQFMAKISERKILTEKQWARLQELIDNPPEHAKILGRQIRGFTGVSEEGAGNDEVSEWQPGPDSWKPGDAIPEQYRRERNQQRGNFPRPE